MLTGLTCIKNGNALKYPWKECIKSLASYCNQVLVATASCDDGTIEDLKALCIEYPHIKMVFTNWKDINTGNGSVLASVVNELLPFVKNEWCVYLQADELIHEQDIENLFFILKELPSNITQLELLRTYFWKDLQTRNTEFEIMLGRVFRKGTHIIGGDGMYLNRLKGEVIRSDIQIYHYSRIGSEEDITKRVRNLDKLFHSQEAVDKFKDFSYTTFTNSRLINYSGSHPKGIKEFYSEKE
jgi:adenylate kinase family enzyme